MTVLDRDPVWLSNRDPDAELGSLELAIQERSLDFSATYVAISDLRALATEHPNAVTEATIRVLRSSLESTTHASQKQSYFLYREIADTLAEIAVQEGLRPSIGEKAIKALEQVVLTSSGTAHRTAAEAMGSFPLSIDGPDVPVRVPDAIPSVRWAELMETAGGDPSAGIEEFGRTLATPLSRQRLLAVKLLKSSDPVEALCAEAAWLEYLGSDQFRQLDGFCVPRLLQVRGARLFRLEDLPVGVPRSTDLHQGRFAICFITGGQYFNYINSPDSCRPFDRTLVSTALRRSAFLLGSLTSLGLVHTAPIPLFHNRVQRQRRPDGGIYEWPRGGRLDRWLSSCDYPNFGLTGLRDFEHMESFRGTTRKLYRWIGTHLLGLLLVAGSCFRNSAPDRIGRSPAGQPVDTRDLFQVAVLQQIVESVFKSYYQGFTGMKAHELPRRFSGLAMRMVEEMGVDRHMEEVLRVADQEQMTDAEFHTFLVERGTQKEAAAGMRRGEEDVVVHTGPHLGAFNERISLPELTEFLATASALCVSGRYAGERIKMAVSPQNLDL